ncbi:MAG: transporter [Neisseria sp.]|nr:transporter [Neisseria sp.]
MLNFTPFKPPLKPFSGSADEALICGYVFADGVAEPLSALQQALDVLQAGGSGFVWLHLGLGNAQINDWLQSHLSLPETFYDNLQEHGDATRIEREEEALIATINDVLFDFDYDADDLATLRMVLLQNLVVTARRKPLRCTDRLRTDIRNGYIPETPIQLLAHLLDDQAEELSDIVQSLVRQTNSIEDRILANRIGRSRAALGNMRRLLVRLRRMLAPEPNALFRLLSSPPDWVSRDDVQELREATEEFASVVQDITSLNERIKMLQEEITAIINEENNRSLYVLTIVTVLALPFNIVAGLFGMNVGGIPLADAGDGFGLIVLALLGFVAVAWWWLWQRGRRE